MRSCRKPRRKPIIIQVIIESASNDTCIALDTLCLGNSRILVYLKQGVSVDSRTYGKSWEFPKLASHFGTPRYKVP